MFDSRLFHFIKKEFIQVLREKRMKGVIVIAPVIQLFIFGYIATLDITNIPTAVRDMDKSNVSREIIASFRNSRYFDIKYYAADSKEETELMDSGRIKVAINIPSDLSLKVKSGRKADIQFLIDGTDSNTAGIAMGYINGIVFEDTLKLLRERLKGRADIDKILNLVDVRVRVFHNQTLKSVNYMVPGIIAMLLMLLTAVMTAVSIVKEKEFGTMEQLIVSPIRPYELMIGKMAPFAVLMMIDVCLVLALSVYWFKVPILGSVPLFFLLCFIFLLTGLGFGLFISTISATMQQTVLSVIFVLLPSILLSGFMFPIANMPVAIQYLTYIIPLRYFLEIVRGLFLKGVGLQYLWPQTGALLIIGVIIFYMAVTRFHKKLN